MTEQNDECRTWQMPSVDGGQATRMNAASYTDELTKLKQAAQQEGFDKGYQDGLNQGAKEVNQMVQQLQEVIGIFNAPLMILSDQVEAQCLLIVETLVKHILRDTLEQNPEHLMSIIKQMKSALPLAKEKLTLQMNPEDQAAIESILAQHKQDNPIEIEANPNLSRGEVILNTENTQIDGTVAARIAAVAEQLRQSNES